MDRICLMDSGIIHAFGSSEELKTKYEVHSLEDLYLKILPKKVEVSS